MWLHLHVGHGKTGSSFLQSWLALNAERLRDRHGFAYPMRSPLGGPVESQAARSRFSMGNGFVLEELLDLPEDAEFVAHLAELAESGAVPLFSRERFMRDLPPHLPRLDACARASGLQGVRILLFVRDPLDHAVSLHAEMVKAHGCAVPLDPWLASYHFLDHVEAFLEAARAIPSVELEVVNYSRVRGRLLDAMLDWLGIESMAEFETPKVRRVNRSLTPAELRVQRLANRCLGSAAGRIGRRLANDLPDVPGRPASPGPAAARRFAERLAPQVQRLNERLPRPHRYRLDSETRESAESSRLDAAAWRIVVREGLAACRDKLRRVTSSR